MFYRFWVFFSISVFLLSLTGCFHSSDDTNNGSLIPDFEVVAASGKTIVLSGEYKTQCKASYEDGTSEYEGVFFKDNTAMYFREFFADNTSCSGVFEESFFLADIV